SAGRRLRRRRRLFATAAVAALAAAVGAGSLAAAWPGPAARVQQPAAAPTRSAAGTSAAGGPWGSVVPTGLRVAGGDLVFYVVPVHDAQLPDVHFAVMAGRQDGN